MNKRTWKIIMVVIGSYLIYNGVRVIYEVINGEPSAQTMLMVFGGIFVVFGALTVWSNIWELVGMLKGSKPQSGSDGSEEDGEVWDEETKASGKQEGVLPFERRKERKGPIMANVEDPAKKTVEEANAQEEPSKRQERELKEDEAKDEKQKVSADWEDSSDEGQDEPLEEEENEETEKDEEAVEDVEEEAEDVEEADDVDDAIAAAIEGLARALEEEDANGTSNR